MGSESNSEPETKKQSESETVVNSKTDIKMEDMEQTDAEKKIDPEKKAEALDSTDRITGMMEDAVDKKDNIKIMDRKKKPDYVDSSGFRRRPKKVEFNPPVGFDVQEGRRSRRA